jgi:hypothetical protein
VGRFSATSPAAAAGLLEAAEAALRKEGCGVAIGPMDGNTWNSYRFVTAGADSRPPFLMEPSNPPEWPLYFESAGWSPLARYVSSVAPLAGSARPGDADRACARLGRAGVRIRPLRTDDYTGELRRLFPACLRSFASNFLYTPVDEETFLSIYGPAAPLVDPDLVLIAERGGEVAGFVFCLRDGDSLVVKTLARLPDPGFGGLGSVLLGQVHDAAGRRGMREAIHALKHAENPSRQTSARHGGQVFREYTLYHKPLTAAPA